MLQKLIFNIESFRGRPVASIKAIPYSHCNFCGSKYDLESGNPKSEVPNFDHMKWPRDCNNCKQITYRNPMPVSVGLLPFYDNGVRKPTDSLF